MPWSLVVVGILFGIAMIMMQVKSPCWSRSACICRSAQRSRFLSVACFARSADWVAERRGFNARKKREWKMPEYCTASGLIAGEALMGLVWAGLQFVPRMEGAEPSAAAVHTTPLTLWEA